MRQTHLVTILLLVAGWPNVTGAQTEAEKLVAESDPAIQAQINTTYNALRQPRIDSQSDVEVFREIQTLKEITDDKGELVKQLAIFAATTESEEEFHVLLMLKILHFLELPPSIPIRVLAPYLDSDNQQLRDFAREWFQGYDKAAGEDPLKAYKSYVRQRLARNEEVPVEFIEYVYERLPPGLALSVFRGGQWPPKKRDDDILLAEHIVSNAIWLKENGFAERFQKVLPEAMVELEKLAKHEEWWARLYVVYIMRHNSPLLRDKLLRQLGEDSNELVSKAAKSIAK